MRSPRRFLAGASGLVAISAVLAVMVLVAFLTSTFSFQAAPIALPGKDRHTVIAITCPYAPFFGIGGDEGREWRLIVSAFSDFGQQAQHLYVSYEDALHYFESDEVQGVWVCGGMGITGKNYYPSAPLLERRFVVATLAENDLEFEQLDTLAELEVGVHPDVLRVLQPQISPAVKGSQHLQVVANHVLLASLLFTGRIDALITEESVFDENLRLVPDSAHPEQPIRFHRSFKPVFPRIVFKDRALRDRFDQALKKISVTQPGDEREIANAGGKK